MTRRGQLVLVAAAALAIALVPMALAHVQLGYDEDVESAAVDTSRLAEAERLLHRALADASTNVPAQHAWSNRDDAVTAVRDRLRPTLTSLNTSRLRRGTVISVTYAQPRAETWATSQCPRGSNRQFGSCVADRGLVVQERLGRTHVLAAAVEVRVTTPRGDWWTVSVVRTGGRYVP